MAGVTVTMDGGYYYTVTSASGGYMRNDLIAREIADLVNEAKTVLYSKFEREMPRLYSDDPAVQVRARKLNWEALDEVCERLRRPLACAEGVEKEVS